MRLLHIHQTGHASSQKKGRSPQTSPSSTHSRVRNKESFMYPHELFCRERHLSGFHISTPDSRNFLPSPTKQIPPHLLCLFSSEVLTGLQQSRRTISHRTTHVNENSWVLCPCFLIPLKPIGPSVLRISQPTVCHRTSNKYIWTTFSGEYSVLAKQERQKTCGSGNVVLSQTTISQQNR